MYRLLKLGLPAALYVCWALCALARAQDSAPEFLDVQLPEAVEERLQLGQDAMARRDFAAARDHFYRVLELDWNNPRVYEWWSAAQDSAARQIRHLLVRGNWLMAAGQYAEALVVYQRARELDGTNWSLKNKIKRAGAKIYAERYVLAALAAFLEEDFERARSRVDSALIFDEQNALALSLSDRIEDNLRQASQADLQEDPEAWSNHLEALKNYRAGEYQAAIALWEKILVKYPGHSEAMANIRQARLRLQADQKPDGEIAKGEE